MPTYVYHCPTCGERFESRQSFSDKPLESCPQGHPGVKRVFTPAGIVFKGSGWYITDSRSGNGGGKSEKTKATSNGKSEAATETKSEAATETKSEAKTESKSEAKTESKSEAKTES